MGLITIKMDGNMLFKRLFLYLSFLCIVNLSAQHYQIPEERAIQWDPGVPGEIPYYPIGSNVMDFGAKGDSLTDNTDAFNRAIRAAEEGTAILIPEGKYIIKRMIVIERSVVLRGEGYQKTKLYFSPNESSNFLELRKIVQNDPWIQLVSGFTRGSGQIVTSATASFSAGDYLEIVQDNDPDYFKPGRLGAADWGENAVGQIVRIANVDGDKIELVGKLYYDYHPDMNPRIRKINCATKVGLENMHLERIPSDIWGNTITIQYAANCWVKNIYSKNTYANHLAISRACHNEIRDCIFDSGHNYDGGHSYGASMGTRATDNLIENNIFKHLRHSMILQMGACGNVFGYNYSIDPKFWDYTSVLMSDIAVHGHYPYMNLFEGNVVQYAKIDNIWGTNGPTTLFRNRIEQNVYHYLDPSKVKEFPFVHIQENNPYQNIINNELGYDVASPYWSTQIDESIKNSTLLHGNYDYTHNEMLWDETIDSQSFPASFYLKEKPEWFGNCQWPCLGGDLAPNNNLIPAQLRYHNLGSNRKPAAPAELIFSH